MKSNYLKNPFVMAGIGITAVVGLVMINKKPEQEVLTTKAKPKQTQSNWIGDVIFGMNPKETNQYYEYLGKSLNPGYGVADLNTTEKIKGLENCAKWCNENGNCEAFTHWWKHPNEEIKDTCQYWSSNQHETETYELPSNALGPRDEGMGAGHHVNSYIKKVSSGYSAENRIKLTCQSHHSF